MIICADDGISGVIRGWDLWGGGIWVVVGSSVLALVGKIASIIMSGIFAALSLKPCRLIGFLAACL